MAKKWNRYSYYCETEQLHIVEDQLRDVAPTQCQHDAGHTITADSVSIVETIHKGQVEVENTVDKEDHDPVRVVVAPGRTGYRMCDRDIKIITAKMGDESFEDMKVNMADNVRIGWGEVTVVGVYKDDGAGGYELCADQTDADSNACLTILDFHPDDQEATPTKTVYEIQGGTLWVDDSLPNDANKWEHQVYVIVAPNIPKAMGGGVRFFDGYLYPYKGNWMQTNNTLAIELDPAQSIEVSRLRVWAYYPAGAGSHTHILRLRTFRPTSTF